jgi:copper chaperone CopZ
MGPSAGEIAKLAYRFYIEDGKPEGCAKEHWARAEEFLRHPENHSGKNVLTVPSEPEITRALDEKGRDLDLHLPSDPHSGKDAFHQRFELALDQRKSRRDVKNLENALKHLPGIERVEVDAGSTRVRIHFDARRTNPAAIHEAVTDREAEEIENAE